MQDAIIGAAGKQATCHPTNQPSQPTNQPSSHPSSQPTAHPTATGVTSNIATNATNVKTINRWNFYDAPQMQDTTIGAAGKQATCHPTNQSNRPTNQATIHPASQTHIQLPQVSLLIKQQTPHIKTVSRWSSSVANYNTQTNSAVHTGCCWRKANV